MEGTMTGTYDEGGVVTGMCLWEALLEMAGPSLEGDDDARATLRGMLGDHGSFTVRAALVSLVRPCEEGWKARLEAEGDGEQFDWDWCPRFLRASARDGSLAAAVEAQYRPG